jgi:hypothetical protein
VKHIGTNDSDYEFTLHIRSIQGQELVIVSILDGDGPGAGCQVYLCGECNRLVAARLAMVLGLDVVRTELTEAAVLRHVGLKN